MENLTLFAFPLIAFVLPFAIAVVMPNWLSWAGFIAFAVLATIGGTYYVIYESGLKDWYGLIAIGLVFVAAAGAINGIVSKAIMLAVPTGMLGKTVITILGLAAGFYTVPALARVTVAVMSDRIAA